MRFVSGLLLVGCTSASQERLEESIVLTVENRVGAQLWYFQYAGCGSDNWKEVIASDEFVANGDDVSSRDLSPGCYDLYVEDEFGCFSNNTTDGNVKGGQEFSWTVTAQDLNCR